MRVCIEALGCGIIERLELVILTGREGVVVFRRGCIEVIGAGGMRVRRRQRRNRHELVIGLRVGKVVLPGEIHREPAEAVVEVERRSNEAGGVEQNGIE